MQVSIITVCYNSVRTIKDTLLSIAAQTHYDIEHIVVDGASNDGTQEVVKAAFRPHNQVHFRARPWHI